MTEPRVNDERRIMELEAQCEVLGRVADACDHNIMEVRADAAKQREADRAEIATVKSSLAETEKDWRSTETSFAYLDARYEKSLIERQELEKQREADRARIEEQEAVIDRKNAQLAEAGYEVSEKLAAMGLQAERIAADELRITEQEAHIAHLESALASGTGRYVDQAAKARIAELESDNDALRDVICNHGDQTEELDERNAEADSLEARLATAEGLLRDLLMSADCSWEERDEGHDWAEACELARAFLPAKRAAGEEGET